MSDLRPLHDTTASHAPPDDFRPADAIESLRAAIFRVDTLAQIARHAADELRYPRNTPVGRDVERMQILVEQAANEASTALAQGDRFMAALTNYLQVRRANQELGDRDDAPARPAPARREKRSALRARAGGARRL